MKPLILPAATILTLGLINITPALAQNQRITCVREQNMITCPNYGSFQYSSNRNNRNRKAINVSCVRDRNMITCPNYGSFRYGSNNNNSSNNNANRNQEINNLYVQVLGRNANADELQNYRQAMNRQGWSLAQVRSNLANSEEFNQMMNKVYQQYLGRNSDTDGLRSHRNAIINGRSFEEVRNEIANSSEARNQNNHGNYYPNNNFNRQEEINNLYIQVLGRNANSNDLRNYHQGFNNRSYSLADVRLNLVNSQEFTQAVNNLYREYLGRNADNNGLQSYRNAVMNGMSFEEVRNEIANSPEARNGNGSDTGDFLENMLRELTDMWF